MHNYNSQRKGKKSECLCSNLASGCPHISNLSIPFLSFILCCWIFFAAENFHLTLQYLKTMIKRKLLLSKCTLPFFYHFFFSFYFLGDFGCTLVSSSTSFLYHLQFQFDGCWSPHTSRVVWLIIWVLISSVLHELLSHDKIAKYHVKIFKTNLNEFSL